MENMKVYKVYLEDPTTEDCFKTIIPAFSEELAMEYAHGNGEVIAIKETTDFPISDSKLTDAWLVCQYQFWSFDDCPANRRPLLFTSR